jgi:hypothetical protein
MSRNACGVFALPRPRLSAVSGCLRREFFCQDEWGRAAPLPVVSRFFGLLPEDGASLGPSPWTPVRSPASDAGRGYPGMVKETLTADASWRNPPGMRSRGLPRAGARAVPAQRGPGSARGP